MAINRYLKIFRLIEKQVEGLHIPWVTKISYDNNPYKVLISCLLSLRTKDEATHQASVRLFKVANSPSKLVKLTLPKIRKLIYPVGFYRRKARTILEISKKILDEYGGEVPDTLDELLKFKGVGRKTANLVLGLSFGEPSICVDTHVHRISNRLGWIRTESAPQTEQALKKILPKNSWIRLNAILVGFGQNICLPISPFCSRCSVGQFCRRIGIKYHR